MLENDYFYGLECIFGAYAYVHVKSNVIKKQNKVKSYHFIFQLLLIGVYARCRQTSHAIPKIPLLRQI